MCLRMCVCAGFRSCLGKVVSMSTSQTEERVPWDVCVCGRAVCIFTDSRIANPCTLSSIKSNEPCSKCLTSWHQIRKCLRHCLRFAYARTGFAIFSYAELTLAYTTYHSFAYATPL